MTQRYVALIRGINVGRAKRVGMTDLKSLVERLGYRDVRTLLNSGNVVFTAPAAALSDAAGKIEKAMASGVKVSARVFVLTADEIATLVDENPLGKVATDPSRLQVTVLADAAGRKTLQPLAKQDWSPERLAIGTRVAYLWCPDGMTQGKLAEAVGRAIGDGGTTRNWATMTKLHALTRD